MRIRHLEASDRDAVVALSSRLTVGVARWRDRDHVGTATRASVVAAIDGHDPEQQPVFVADDVDGSVVGFVSVSSRSHWSGGTDAYAGELAVAECAARRGVGSALMHAAENGGATRGIAG